MGDRRPGARRLHRVRGAAITGYVVAGALLLGAILLLGFGASGNTGPGSISDSGSPSLPSGIGGPHAEYDDTIRAACADAGLPDPWPVVVKAIITQESGWQVGIEGDDGRSIGLMQIN